jgi:hypothetical protein
VLKLISRYKLDLEFINTEKVVISFHLAAAISRNEKEEENMRHAHGN